MLQEQRGRRVLRAQRVGDELCAIAARDRCAFFPRRKLLEKRLQSGVFGDQVPIELRECLLQDLGVS